MACADLVLVNKADRSRMPTVPRSRPRSGASCGPACGWSGASHGRLDPAVALGLGVGAEDDLASRPSHHDDGEEHDHDDFESFVLDLPAVADPARRRGQRPAVIAAHDILRVKGFLAVTGKPTAATSSRAVGDRIERYYDRPWRADEERRSALVVIGQQGLDHAAIRAAVTGEASA